MEISKKNLINELKGQIESKSIQPESTDSVVNALFSLMKIHIQKGDRIDIKEFSVYRKGHRRRSDRKYSSRSGKRNHRKDSGKRSRTFSSFFLINELSLMVHDSSYLMRKAVSFSRNVFIIVAVLFIYYLLTVLVGC